jgi:hypothetical protein
VVVVLVPLLTRVEPVLPAWVATVVLEMETITVVAVVLVV